MTSLDHIAILAATFAAMLILSAVAAFAAPRGARLPMQWGVNGKPTWTAATPIAVLFTPTVAAIVLAPLVVFGDSPAMRTVLPAIAMLFLVIHAAHLYFALRHVAARGN